MKLSSVTKKSKFRQLFFKLEFFHRFREPLLDCLSNAFLEPLGGQPGEHHVLQVGWQGRVGVGGLLTRRPGGGCIGRCACVDGGVRVKSRARLFLRGGGVWSAVLWLLVIPAALHEFSPLMPAGALN